ncbi:MAG: substrate-binding domain-containing protein [Clostridiales bacterium]|jgi:phosphate transport system substrate-binding protein|nr:substrate-binding domain-containing protein [Clostridiales bacterium]
MKKSKLLKVFLMVLCAGVGLFSLTACPRAPKEKDILVIARSSGSGTRDAFDGLIKNVAGDSLAKTAGGAAQPSGIFVESIVQLDSTGAVITKVASAATAIGYVSLGSVDGTVKAVSVNGVAPSAETVLDGGYALKRPFVIITNKSVSLTAAAADFMRYLNSSDAQLVVEDGYVRQDGDGKTAYMLPESNLSGRVYLRGSTSVEPLMDDLIADYIRICGSKAAGVEFNLDTVNSSAGIADAKADNVGNVIGMSSSALKEADGAALNHFDIALDAVAVVVNNGNGISNLTVAQIFDIYTGAIKKFSQLR